jgi:antitoxin component of MazEF toxin-antitoxin module
MSLLTAHVLVAQATVYKHTKGNTLYVSIPSKMAQDSVFPVKEGDQVEIVWDKDLEAIVIKPKKPSSKRD